MLGFIMIEGVEGGNIHGSVKRGPSVLQIEGWEGGNIEYWRGIFIDID